jgi:LuxR family maltose regulon positive regulatory protein
MPVKILIVDDHPVFIAGLRLLLQLNEDIEIVGEARDGQQAVDLTERLKPDVVVMDINMPDVNGIEATERILAINPDAVVLALSIHSGKRFVQGMIKAGAKGYLLKDAVPEELNMAIKKLAQGGTYISPSIGKFDNF